MAQPTDRLLSTYYSCEGGGGGGGGGHVPQKVASKLFRLTCKNLGSYMRGFTILIFFL
jgi:hypothetical protein